MLFILDMLLRDHGNSIDFKQVIVLEKCRNAHQGTGWRLIFIHISAADFAQRGKIFRLVALYVPVNFYDIIEGGARSGQDHLQVLKNLRGLGLEIVFADEFACLSFATCPAMKIILPGVATATWL